MPGTLLIDRPEPEIALLTLNRPATLNAMTAELVEELHDAFDQVDADPSCRVVILTGAGRAFCAGLDLNGYGSAPGALGDRMSQAVATQQHISSLIGHLRDLRQPVIAAVNGAATGGGLALVLGSDIRLASSAARFSAAFIKIGVSGCDIGTSWLLPKVVGLGHAHEMMLTGRLVESAEAARIGLVLDVVEPEQLLERSLAEARMILANSPFGVQMTKETMWASIELPGLDATLVLENHTQLLCLGSEDQSEAVRAFLEKRAPRWAPAP